MSWALAANWLAVAGLVLLTFGTGAQAWANLAEFRGLKLTVPQASVDVVLSVAGAAMAAALTPPITIAVPLGGGFKSRFRWLGFPLMILTAIISIPLNATKIRAEGGDEAVQLARFLRLAVVWAILMVGSALALAAAVIQLTLAYQ